MKPFAPADVDAMHSLWTDPGVRRYLWDNRVIDREIAEEVVLASVSDWREFAIGMWTLEIGAAIAGFCGFRRFGDPAEWELMYGVAPALWGRGVAVEATRAAIDFAFATTSWPRVWARTDPPNAASVRVMEKIGLRFHASGVENGLEIVSYVLSRDEWIALKTSQRSEA